MGEASLWAGAMSGTSLDGVDAVLCRFDGERFRGVQAHGFAPYPEPLRRQLQSLQAGEAQLDARGWAELDQQIARLYIEALQPVLRGQAGVQGIGMHGQTVFHDPAGVGNSLQLGNPHWVAAVCGAPVVSDFRRADIALGGQGAPLVPAFHAAAFHVPGQRVAVVNIGGIANLSLIAGDGQVSGQDLGPGNGLMDEWIQHQRGAPWDAEGAWAASGAVNAALLAALRSEPWFALPPPRSTGRDQFSLRWARVCAPELATLPPADVQRTLLELTAGLIAETAAAQAADRLYCCGGGTRNRLLMARISALMPSTPVESTAALGLDPQQVEAAAFAWLAKMRLEGRRSGQPSVTGARQAACLGSVSLP